MRNIFERGILSPSIIIGGPGAIFAHPMNITKGGDIRSSAISHLGLREREGGTALLFALSLSLVALFDALGWRGSPLNLKCSFNLV